ncbi:hypothetical protein VTI74DRAFT_9846 [Chaetomium olivicolor]
MYIPRPPLPFFQQSPPAGASVSLSPDGPATQLPSPASLPSVQLQHGPYPLASPRPPSASSVTGLNDDSNQPSPPNGTLGRHGVVRAELKKREYTMRDQNITIGVIVGVLLAVFLAGFFYFVSRYHKSIRVRTSSRVRSGAGTSHKGPRSARHGSHSSAESAAAAAAAAIAAEAG